MISFGFRHGLGAGGLFAGDFGESNAFGGACRAWCQSGPAISVNFAALDDLPHVGVATA